jgi:hypothetical protein
MAQGIDRSDFADIEGTYFGRSYQPPSPVTDQAGFERYASFAQNELMPLIDKQVKYQESIKRQRNADLAFQQTQLSIQKNLDEAATQRKHFQDYSQIGNYVDSLIEGGGDASDMLNSFYDLRSKKPLLDAQSTKFLELQEERIKAIGVQQKAAEAPRKMADQNIAQAYAYGMPKDLLDQNILTGIYRGDPEAKKIALQSLSTVKELEKQEKRESEYLKLQKSELEKLASFSPTPEDLSVDIKVPKGTDTKEFKALGFDTMYKAIQARMRIDGSSDDPAVFKMLSDKFIIDPEEAVKSGLSPEEVLRTQLNFIQTIKRDSNIELKRVTTTADPALPFQISPAKRKEQEDIYGSFGLTPPK